MTPSKSKHNLESNDSILNHDNMQRDSLPNLLESIQNLDDAKKYIAVGKSVKILYENRPVLVKKPRRMLNRLASLPT
jgi:hypothetical protein